MKKNEIGIGLLGFGTVGQGTYQTLEMNRALISKESGIDFQVKKILVRDKAKLRDVSINPDILTDDYQGILSDPSVDIVVEVLGGVTPAKDLMIQAMANGKHVVTANKAAVASDFHALKRTAETNGVQFRYEASVAGGIPIINALSTALRSNEILKIKGILNGTTNYILTQMTNFDLGYTDALQAAQDKGFAEADPTDDVEGIDAANKLSILMSLAFGIFVKPNEISTTGISDIGKETIAAAAEKGQVIKLLATAEKTLEGIQYSVAPESISSSHPLAGVHNEFNAVFIEGNAAGELMFYGRGAGALPTGSAVLGDIIGIGIDHVRFLEAPEKR